MSLTTDLQTAYTHLAAAYDANRDQFDIAALLAGLRDRLPGQGELLDLGCGAGIPVAQTFLGHGWGVVGVDACPAMLALAERHVPSMRRIQGDMRRVGFAPGSFDAVTAVYSLFHLPWHEHGALFRRIAQWLRPGGRLFFTYATAAYTGQERFEGWMEFMGEQLFYSHTTPVGLHQQLAQAGLEVEFEQQPSIAGETFLWVTARHARVSASSAA